MEWGSTEIPPGAMDDIAYLGRSENRLRLLHAVTEEPATRSSLVERTEIASTTIGRILNELQGRNWVKRTSEGQYDATPTGRNVVRVFMPLVGAMDTIGQLGDAVGMLPMEEIPIGIQHFREATVVEPAPNAPYEIVELLAERISEATVFRVLTFLDPPPPVGEVMQEGVFEDRLTAEHVLAGGLVEYLRKRQKKPPRWRQYIEAGATVYRYEGHIPCNLFIVDETVLIMNDRPKGGGAAILSENETVRSALSDLFDSYRDSADLVTAEYFA